MKYSEKDMAALISEVETSFSDYLSKSETEETTIQKSETEETTKVETAVEGETVEKTEEETALEAEFDYDEEDFTEMDKLYSSMNKAEAKAHYQSLKKTLFVEGEEVVVEKEEVISKSETEDKDTIAKSEYEAVVAKNEELSKSVESLTVSMTNFLKGKAAPKRKAITNIEYVAKSEGTEEGKENNEDMSKLSKTEVAKRLTAKIRSNSLEKSDRDLINNFYLEDNASFDSIKHLL